MDMMEEQVGSTRVVAVTGRLDGSSSTAFAERVGGLLGDSNPKLLVDLAGVDFVTSAGLRAVMQIVKRVKASGGVLAVCSLQEPVREILEISGFAAMLTIHPARADAIAALDA